jgi:hypothetical protein
MFHSGPRKPGSRHLGDGGPVTESGGHAANAQVV